MRGVDNLKVTVPKDQIKEYLVSLPKPRSRLEIEEDVIAIESVRPVPNRWHRFWYKILLGWQWIDLTRGETVMGIRGRDPLKDPLWWITIFVGFLLGVLTYTVWG